MREIIKGVSRVITGVLALTFTVGVYAQSEDYEINSQQLNDKLYMLTGKGGNIGLLIGDQGTFMIDDQYGTNNEGVIAAIKSLGGDLPKYLVNTHFHSDHTGGNSFFSKQGTVLIGHDNVRNVLEKGFQIKAFNLARGGAPEAALPALTYSETMTLYFNNTPIHIFHVKDAHTTGDSVVYFPRENAMHMGDLFFNGFYPFIDTDNGGSVKGYVAAIEQLLALVNDDTQIIPGHGPLADKADLQAYYDMLSTVYDLLVAAKADGKSLSQIQDDNILADYDAKWGSGLFTSARWLELVYPSISAE